MSEQENLQTILGRFGMTGQEATIYCALLEYGDMNGYEAARETGISRSNAYHALAGLVDKGFAYRAESETPSYSAMAATELALVARARCQADTEAFLRAAPVRRVAPSPFMTVSGRQHVLERMQLMLSGARDRVYASMAAAELETVATELARCLERGIRVTLITSADFALAGAVIHRREKQAGQVRLIVDGAQVLTGEWGAQTGACVWSENPQLVALIKDSLTNEIQLIHSEEAGRNCHDNDAE